MARLWGQTFTCTALLLLISAIVIVHCSDEEDEISVNSITPRYGSLYGGMALTIYGTGFAKNQFNFGAGSEHLGNFVMMVSGTTSYICDIHKDGCTEFQIMCYTRPMVEDDYRVQVTIDGISIPKEMHCVKDPSLCIFKPQSSNTPLLSAVHPRTGPPGTIFTMFGRIFTSRVGSNEAESTNGNSQQILRAYVGGQKCELIEDFSESKPYGITLDQDGASDYGNMICLMKGSYVSNINASFMIEPPYGRSFPDRSVLRLFADDSIAMFQTYARIDSVSPSSGSVAGGTLLTITGDYFDNTDKPLDVQIAGTQCEVVNIAKEQVICQTAAKPEDMELYRGGRGITHKRYNISVANLDDLSGLADQEYTTSQLDIFSFSYSSEVTTVSHGFLVVPATGKYTFELEGKNCMARLYFDGSESCTNMSEAFSKVYGNLENHHNPANYSLEARMNYCVKLIHSSSSSDNRISLSLRMYNTSKTEHQTGSAVNERQKLTMTSDIVPETQKVSFSSWNVITSSTNEVQTLEILHGGSSGVNISLGLDEAFSAWISPYATSAEIATALNSLPSVAPDMVTVETSAIDDGFRHVVTFVSERGVWPLMDYKVQEANAVTVSAVRSTQGVASLAQAVLEMDGRFTKPIPIDANTDAVKVAIEDLFSVRCPSSLDSPPYAKFKENFETLTGAGSFYGKLIENKYAMCGRKSIENPIYIVNLPSSESIDLTKYPFVCFGYNGFVYNSTLLNFTYRDYEGLQSKRKTFSVQLKPYDGKWHHKCINVKELLEKEYPEGRYFYVNQVRVLRVWHRETLFDNIYSGNVSIEETELSRVRLMPPSDYLMNAVEVSGVTEGEYTIKMYPVNCSYPFSLFKIRNGPESVTLINSASPPVTGTFDIKYNGNILEDVPADVEDHKLKLLLQTSLPGIGDVSVTRNGLCHSFNWEIDWQQVGGDVPSFILDTTNIEGSNANITPSTLEDGYAFFKPLIGDMLFQVHNTSQVTVSVNGIPSLCNETCEFVWSEDDTPSVTSVTPDTGPGLVTLTINGVGFDSTLEVYVGGIECSSVVAVGDQLTCDLDIQERGVHDILVFVSGKGKAVGALSYEFVSEVTSITPDEGHLSGGYMVTISGSGLKHNMGIFLLNETVECIPLSADNTTSVVCQMLPAAEAGVTDVILMFDDGTSLNVSAGFTFLDKHSATVVTSLSTNIASVLGGTELTISGTSFGDSIREIKLGPGAPLDPATHWNDTHIVSSLPSLPMGEYLLLISAADGYADLSTHSIGMINYVLNVDDITPRTTNKHGGSRHTLTGEGFGTDGDVVKVALAGADCAVETVSDTEIVCIVLPTSRHHKIDNLGTDAMLGKYFAWNPALLVVEVGDIVDFEWTAPDSITEIKYTVQQTDDISSKSAKVNGFMFMKPPSLYGQYSYQFSQGGSFPYWSAPVDSSNTIILRGRIDVMPRKPLSGDVVVQVGDQQAEINIQAVSRKKRSVIAKRDICTPEVNSCALTSAGIINSCSEDPVVVDSITPNSGTSTTVITIVGRGFSTSACNNVITFGAVTCDIDVDSLNSTHMTCKLSPEQLHDVQPGDILPAKVMVNNLGDAPISQTGEVNKGFKLIPRISGLSHHTGSLNGGHAITITGDGFVGKTLVVVGGTECMASSIDYDKIVCVTSSSGGSASSGDIQVQVQSASEVLTAECEGDCDYAYSPEQTPEVISSSSLEVSAADTVLTIKANLIDSDTASVSVGETICGDVSITKDSDSSTIECTVGNLVAGSHSIAVTTELYGRAIADAISIFSKAHIEAVNPTGGSTEGGLLVTITGNGFSEGIQVYMGDVSCEVQSGPIDAGEVICMTAAHNEEEVQVVVKSADDSDFSSDLLYFNYTAEYTPTISNISPSEGFAGDNITIQCTNLDDNKTAVYVGEVECVLKPELSQDGEVVCTLGKHSAGYVEVIVDVEGKGKSSAVEFTYKLVASSYSPTSGSFGGGQLLTINGAGFDDTVSVKVCDQPCASVEVIDSSTIECYTPPREVEAAALECNVTMFTTSVEIILSSSYNYDPDVGGTVSSISPSRGGTAGGTTLTISGNFPNIDSASVKIDGVPCEIENSTETSITCVTGAHGTSGKFEVKVALGSDGDAVAENLVEFFYVDVWSSKYTWGGQSPPEAGQLVEVPKGNTLLLDMDTPVLKVLLIRGSLVFDEKDVELNAEIILIVDGGTLQVGTEEEPFQHKGIITLHGHLRSLEMPIYGTKTLSVRNGTLDLHGKPRVPWTVLAQTANAGAKTIVLSKPVDWESGDKLAIASTGGRHSQKENEEREIEEVSSDGLNVTLTEALEYVHLGETATIGGKHKLEMRAEVGLLTHNVLVRGSINHQWDEVIEACPAGFDTGQFATQTCFQGRFGEEMGSDEFGGTIMMHAPDKTQEWVISRFSYIEVTHAGQAFRLGRYPIHFHLNGHQPSSYVRGCSVHRTFNRAINVHNSHDVRIEHNVIYHIMGGAVFLEDSAETGNVLEYNLAIFVIPSTSLLNDDITPAAFWLTHPTNIVRHNHAAGGSHFGFWYRMHSHPQGPSADSSLCPKNAPLTEFSNNTAHSLGWFGLWTFEDYFPMDGEGVCSARSKNIPAVFKSLTAWHCHKGAEYVNGGDLQFEAFFLVNNEASGFEGKINKHHTKYSLDLGPVLRKSIIAAKTEFSGGCTKSGIILPFSEGFMVDDVEFVDFNSDSCVAIGVTSITGKSTKDSGGWTYKFTNITWTDSNRKGAFRWEHEAALEDMDGSLTCCKCSETTGTVGAKIVPLTGSLSSTKCEKSDCEGEDNWSHGAVEGRVCETPYPFHRYSFNNAKPSSLMFKNVLVTTEGGVSSVPFQRKRLTHPEGWMFMIEGHQRFSMAFENAEHLVNTSSDGVYYNFGHDDYLIVEKELYQKPDRFQVVSGQERNNSETELTYEDNYHGDWHLKPDPERDIFNFSYIVSGKDRVNKRSEDYGKDRSVNFRVSTCFFKECQPPIPFNKAWPNVTRPIDALFWSNDNSWKDTEEGYGGNNEDGTFGKPKANTNVLIKFEQWMVLDEPEVILDKLYIYGVLEFEFAKINDKYMDFTLSATHILLYGGRLFVGWENNPMRGNVEIILRGNHRSEEVYTPMGPTVGAKAIAVFGSLDMHGVPRSVYWTRLSQTANKGSSDITVAEEVDWVPDDIIVITTTGKSAWEGEIRKIDAVSADKMTLTLNESLTYKHTALSYTSESESANYSYSLTAEVGLLTRNVKVIGEEYDNLQDESFGGRILVSDYFDQTGLSYTGYARVENVEFYHMGQEGFVDYEDPRFALSYLYTGVVTDRNPSYIKSNSFRDNFNTAIGVIDADGIVVENNVIHGTVDAGIRVKSKNITLDKNLVSFSQARGCYQDRVEIGNYFFHGSIEIMDATSAVILRDNAVAGSERNGYSIAGVPCSAADVQWSGNVAHGVLSGVVILPEFVTPSPCVKITGFTVYHSHDFAIYVQTSSAIEFENLIVVDNNLGIMPLIMGPPATSHGMGTEYAQISKSLIVGSSADRDCTLGYSADPVDDCNQDSTGQARSWNSPSGGSVGISFGQFMGGSNNAPFKLWKGLLSYNANQGRTIIKDVIFENFGIKCSGKRDYAISTSPSNEDGQHPVEVSSVTLKNVDLESRLFFHRPDVGKINSADCVDMDCDAKKKCMVKNEDGTFFNGLRAAAIPESEFEWNGDRRRGLGDYRIPKTLLTDQDGNRLNVDDIAPNKGIIFNKDCEFKDEWTAYFCQGMDYDYEMLLIESMDSDTETRRLSPVAVLGEKYIDLINGPQDHGWCSGYTCRKRVSTFMSLVATGQHYALYFTSTSPQKLRLTLLHASEEEAITLEIFYEISNKVKVTVDGADIPPLNGNEKGANCEHCPQVTSENGANFQNRWLQLMYVTVRGNTPVNLEMTSMIMLTMTLSITEEQFFGPQLTQNLATFFGIDSADVRVVEVISEQTQLEKRRKRAINPGHIVVMIEIGGTTTVSVNETVTEGLSLEQLTALREEIIDAVQTGELSAQLGIPYSSVYISVPLPDPSDPEWANVAAEVEEAGIEVRLPSALNLFSQPGTTPEGSLLGEINVQLVDIEGGLVTKFGNNKWVASAELKSPSGSDSALLYGNLTVPLTEGWANFSELFISGAENGYTLEFYVSSPNNMSHIKGVSDPFNISRREIDAVVTTLESITANEEFSVEVKLVNDGADTPFIYNEWKDMSFTVFITLNPIVNYTGGELVTSVNWDVADPSNGEAVVTALTFTEKNAYVLDIEIKSTPDNSYSLTTVSPIILVYPVGSTEVDPLVTREVTLFFTGTMSDIGTENAIYFEITLFNHLLHSHENVTFGTIECNENLMCLFAMAGEVDMVDDRLLALYESLKSSMAIMFDNNNYQADKKMMVNGEQYYGNDGPPSTETEDNSNALPLWVIIVVACGGALFLLIILATVIIVKMKKGGKVRETPSSPSPMVPYTFEESMLYVGCPPTSTKLPPLEPKSDIDRMSEKVTSEIPEENQSISSPKSRKTKKVQVKPIEGERRWVY